MKTFQIHLIRHGLTEANLNGQYAGATDFELLDEGKRRLAELKRDFSYPAADEIVSSPLKRCRQTAEILYPEQVAKIENAFARHCFSYARRRYYDYFGSIWDSKSQILRLGS